MFNLICFAIQSASFGAIATLFAMSFSRDYSHKWFILSLCLVPLGGALVSAIKILH